jgi:hypothetical protein
VAARQGRVVATFSAYNAAKCTGRYKGIVIKANHQIKSCSIWAIKLNINAENIDFIAEASIVSTILSNFNKITSGDCIGMMK